MSPKRSSRKPPKFVDLGYRRIEIRMVKEVDPEDKNYGLFIESKNLILVAEEHKGPDRVNTVLHELLHAMFKLRRLKDARELEKDEMEEHLVENLANDLVELYRRNPRLLQWVDHELHGARRGDGK